MRSFLFVPGHDSRKLLKALDSGADALILDLEDAVPEHEKAGARALCAEFVREYRERLPLFVRVNALDSGLLPGDMAAVVQARPFGLVVPKCEDNGMLERVGHYLTALEARDGLLPGEVRLLPIVTETAASMTGIASYAQARHERLFGMLWGAEDLSADTGARASRRHDGAYAAPFELARSLCLFGAVAAKANPIDAVFTDFRDHEGLARECEHAARDGFTGKAAIHPAQIEVINQWFTPSVDEVERAQRIVEAFRQAPQAGAISLDGKMLDRPHLRGAERLLARAGRSE
ncbi:CoA ester lyase [Caballeronia sp. LZ035]|uniref:HpcH/HpaI aldolase/citrate lyase family protein n=1 Tax=Caballeronia sp. LZ035 TaxID=3038568 RepID=UPI0028632454|nr:CoA ester lyase [Caballeronia sp. LZ035]MDR5760562.1 CoA ester lyase [Caballeronia sp. LZ035]